MRDLVVSIILFAGAFAALRRPWIGIMFWALVSVMNPHKYCWGFAVTMPFAQVTALCTFIGMFVGKEKNRLPMYPPVIALIAFTVWQTLSHPFSFNVDGSSEMWTRVLKINLMILVTMAVLRTRKHIEILTATLALSLGILGVKGGIFTIISGGSHRVYGPEGTFIGGNNEIALAFTIIIPLVYYLSLQAKSKLMRWGAYAMMALCAVSAIGSQSRGALISLAAMALLLWWQSPRKLSLGTGLIVAVVFLLPLMPETWWDRMGTIKTYEDDSSAMGRIWAWQTAFNVATHNFFGGGYFMWTREVFNQYADNPLAPHRVAHSIYFQVLGEKGFVGLFMFMWVWLSTWWMAGWARRTPGVKDDPQFDWARRLCAMSRVALLGYLVGGAFLSLAYFDLPYYLTVLVVLVRKHISLQLSEQQEVAEGGRLAPTPGVAT